MSRTIRRKNFSSTPFLFDSWWADENYIINGDNGRFDGMSIKVANEKKHAWFHSDCFCSFRSPGKDYRKTYRAKSSMQLRNQILKNDYENISIDKHCDEWKWW